MRGLSLIHIYSGEEYLLNYQELTDALDASIYTSQEQLEMMRSCRFDLRFEGLKTQTVFYPPFTASFFFINQEPDARNDSIFLPKAQSVGFTYSFLCMDINWGSEKVQKILRQDCLLYTSCAHSNVLMIKDGVLCTPPRDNPVSYTHLPYLKDGVHMLCRKLHVNGAS